MSWIRSLLRRHDPSRRLPQQFPLTRTEQFERRLCLGRLVTPQAEVAPTFHPPMDSAPAHDGSYLAADLSQSESPEAEPIRHAAPDQQFTATSSAPLAAPPASTTGAFGALVNPALGTSLGEQSPSSGAAETPKPLGSTDGLQSGTGADPAPGTMSGTTGVGTPGGAATAAPADGTATPQTASAESQAAASGNSATGKLSADALARLGLKLDGKGNAIGLRDHRGIYDAWWKDSNAPVVVRYDFRDQGGFKNLITAEQKALAVQALNAWSDASGGKIIFIQDTTAHASQIINLGTGDLKALGYYSGAGGTLGLGGGRVTMTSDGQFQVTGVTWLDHAENWDMTIGNGDPPGTIDYFTVLAHEQGHALGYADADQRSSSNMMSDLYDGERPISTIGYAAQNTLMYRTIESADPAAPYDVLPMSTTQAQLAASEVQQILAAAAAATASNDGIFAVVDRNGRILGVRVEADVLATITDVDTLVFAIDGAVAKARTAAFFANDQAPLTSRVIQFISQSTITQREVESNPNVDNLNAATADASTIRGPGLVAPIGVGGHFPPNINFTPPVDLFAIEHTNRDSNIAPGNDRIKGTPDDIILRTTLDAATGQLVGRFNIDPAFVPAGQGLFAPESYGTSQNSGLLPDATSRGIATLPGGIPLVRDTDGNGVGDEVVGGIGVFFPGPDGFATHEQGFIPGIGQSSTDRVNAPRVLEAEYIAFMAAGGSATAAAEGVINAKLPTVNGTPTASNLDLPFGRIDLVGINLPLFGTVPSLDGLQSLIVYGNNLGAGDANSGADQPLIGGVGGVYRDGVIAPDGWLVTPHDSAVDNLTAADVQTMISQAIAGADAVRAGIRLPLGSRAKMVFAVTDSSGEVLGLYRMPDATVFSIDVAVAKARNVSYYNDASDLQAVDQVTTPGDAYTNRTFRFLAEPRFPSGPNGTPPPAFSSLNDPGINQQTAENTGAPTPVGQLNSVLNFDSFHPMSNFRDPGDPTVVAMGGGPPQTANQNGVVFFPGSAGVYKNGQLAGGLGVSGDGVDQDDVVTFLASQDYLPAPSINRADEVFVNGVRLPYSKFLRNPFG